MNGERREDRLGLSEAGRARREAMLGDLRAEVPRAAARRRRRRAAVSTVVAIALVGVAAWLVVGGPAAGPGSAPTGPSGPVAGDGQDAPRGGAREGVMVDRRADLAAYAIDDEELLEELRAAGRPAGLVRIGETVRLTADVTDRAQEDGEQEAGEPAA